MTFKDNPIFFRLFLKVSLTIILLFFCFFSKAQIGSLGGFHTIHLANKGDLVVSLGKSSSQIVYAPFNSPKKPAIYETQVAYVLNKYLSIQAAYHSFIQYTDQEKMICQHKKCMQSYNNNFFHLAIGTYKKFDLKRALFFQNKKRNYKVINKSHLLFDCYINYGKSHNLVNYHTRINRDEYSWGSSTILKFDQFNIQSNFNFNSSLWGIGFSTIYGLVKFNKIVVLKETSSRSKQLIAELREKRVHSIYGLNYQFWLGIKHVKAVYSIQKKYFFNNLSLHESYVFDGTFNKYTHFVSVQINLSAFKFHLKKKNQSQS